MNKLWTVLTTLVILSLTLSTIACGGGATEPTGGEKSLPTSVSATDAGGGSADQGSSGQTCCWREVGTLPPTMPTGQIDDWGGLIVDAISSQHMDVSYTQCPLRVDFSNSKSWMDYQFQGQIIVNEQTGFIESSGNILGSFTFKLQLVDLHRGKVVKEGQISWVGESTNRVIGERKLFGIGAGFDQIKELSASFKPLPEIIHDYERLPEKATLELEKDHIPAGEKMTIRLKDIVDYKNRPSQSWQWVIVKAEKGQIEMGNNGRDAGEGAVAFEVGKDGAIDFDYKAPDKCDKDTEHKDTITVYNSCNNDPRTAGSFPKEKVIATKSFDIDCTGWLLEATYTYGESCSGGCCSGAYTYALNLTADLKSEPDWTDYFLGQLYVADSAHVDLRFSNDVVQSCTSFCTEAPLKSSHQASYLGNLSLPVWLWTIPPSVSAGNLSRFERDYMWNPAAQNAGEAGQIWGMTPGTYTLNLDGFAYPLVSKAESLARDSLNLPPLKYSYSCDYEVCDVNTDYPCTNCRVETDAGSDYMPAFGEQSYLPAGLLVTMHDWFYEDPLHSPVQYSGNESVLKLDIARSSRDEDVRGLLFEFPGQLTSSSNCSGPLELGAFISYGGEFHSHIKWTLTRMEE